MEGCCNNQINAKNCGVCNLNSWANKVCAQCHAVWYCGRECQKKGWKTGHKSVCAELKAKLQKLPDDPDRIFGMAEAAHANRFMGGVDVGYLGCIARHYGVTREQLIRKLNYLSKKGMRLSHTFSERVELFSNIDEDAEDLIKLYYAGILSEVNVKHPTSTKNTPPATVNLSWDVWRDSMLGRAFFDMLFRQGSSSKVIKAKEEELSVFLPQHVKRLMKEGSGIGFPAIFISEEYYFHPAINFWGVSEWRSLDACVKYVFDMSAVEFLAEIKNIDDDNSMHYVVIGGHDSIDIEMTAHILLHTPSWKVYGFRGDFQFDHLTCLGSFAEWFDTGKNLLDETTINIVRVCQLCEHKLQEGVLQDHVIPFLNEFSSALEDSTYISTEEKQRWAGIKDRFLEMLMCFPRYLAPSFAEHDSFYVEVDDDGKIVDPLPKQYRQES